MEMEVVLMSGAAFYTGRKEVVDAIQTIAEGVIVTTAFRGLDRAIAAACNSRQGVVAEVMPREEGETMASHAARLVARVKATHGRAVVFTDGKDRWALTLIITAGRLGVPVTVVRGHVLSVDLQRAERAKVIDAVEDVAWRQEEDAGREAFFETGAHYESDHVEYHAHDVLNPERQLERDTWNPYMSMDPHARPRTVGATSIKRVKDGVIPRHTIWNAGMPVDIERVPLSVPAKVVWDRPEPYGNPFADEDELVNLEDFTTDECAIIDLAMGCGYGGKISWRIQHGVPLSRELFEEMKQVVDAWK